MKKEASGPHSGTPAYPVARLKEQVQEWAEVVSRTSFTHRTYHRHTADISMIL